VRPPYGRVVDLEKVAVVAYPIPDTNNDWLVANAHIVALVVDANDH
jgi:hypothetical protein